MNGAFAEGALGADESFPRGTAVWVAPLLAQVAWWWRPHPPHPGSSTDGRCQATIPQRAAVWWRSGSDRWGSVGRKESSLAMGGAATWGCALLGWYYYRRL